MHATCATVNQLVTDVVNMWNVILGEVTIRRLECLIELAFAAQCGAPLGSAQTSTKPSEAPFFFSKQLERRRFLLHKFNEILGFRFFFKIALTKLSRGWNEHQFDFLEFQTWLR